MESINSTTFLTLPTILQLQIIKLVSWKDQKNLRLACRHTLALVNYLGASSTFLYINTGNPLLIQRLKNYPFSQIEGVALGWLTTSLPIKTSTRLSIPKTNRLYIGPSISPENMLKLIRYYMKCCKTLVFEQPNFPFMKNIAWFGPSQNCLVNVKTLEIHFSGFRYGEYEWKGRSDFQQRLKSFGQFLLWSSIPCLRELVLSIRQYESTFPVALPNDNKFYENLQKFLIKHGPRLNRLSLRLSSSFWVTIMSTFEYMVNLEKFEIVDSGGMSLNKIDRAVLSKGFNHFAKLKSIQMDSGNEHNFNLASLLLSNNQNTIKSLDLKNILSSFEWFYKIRASFHNLTYLDLKVKCDENCTIFNGVNDQQVINGFKLDSLYKLIIHIASHVGRDGGSIDWRESFINWLIGFSPNLQVLKLTYFDKMLPRISDALLMIHGLTRLHSITFQTYREYEFMGRQFWSEFRYCGPFVLTFELVHWLKNNPQVLDLQIVVDECVVNITRPYIFDQQPEEEEA